MLIRNTRFKVDKNDVWKEKQKDKMRNIWHFNRCRDLKAYVIFILNYNLNRIRLI